MRISTKGRYGLRAMLDLAIHSSGGHVSLNSIADRQRLSEGYLEQVFSSLRKAGLVRSIKGPQGGYTLSRNAAHITAGDILRALEGDLSVVDSPDERDHRGNVIEYCLANELWRKINDSISATVDSITLADLVACCKRLEGNFTMMYYI